MVASLNCSRMDVNMVMLDRLAGRSVAEAHVMDYELILFDADGTLFDYDRAERHALEKACRMHRLEYSERLLERYRKINSALWRQLEEGFITSAEIRVERFRSLLCELGLDAASAPELAQDYLSHLAQGAYLIDGAEEICRYLAPNYRLAILTNGIQEVQTSRFQASPLVPYFDRLIISEEVGFSKPRPEIFEYAMNALGHRCRSTTMIVGDSLTSDMRGGINYGIATCWYNPQARENDMGLEVDHEIYSLDQLGRIL
jgi:2-haloacid dehalogenase